MREGWLIDRDYCWIWRFWRDESAWVRARRFSWIGGDCFPMKHRCLKSVAIYARKMQSECGGLCRHRGGNR